MGAGVFHVSRIASCKETISHPERWGSFLFIRATQCTFEARHLNSWLHTNRFPNYTEQKDELKKQVQREYDILVQELRLEKTEAKQYQTKSAASAQEAEAAHWRYELKVYVVGSALDTRGSN